MSEIVENFLNQLGPWFFSHGLKIVAVIVVAYFVRRFSDIFIEKIIRKAVVSDHFLSKEAEKKREDTLIRVFEGVLGVVIWAVAVLMILSELNINIGPLLAGAGIAGVALGFGAQYIVRDFLAGLFLVLENQYRVGDVVCLDETCGVVEDINLRMTILRDLDGTVHHITNGQIKKAANLSKEFARVNLSIGIAYNSDLEKVIKLVNRVGQELAKDLRWKDKIIEAPKFLRVDDFADSAIIIKILGKTRPLQQWDITGELRKRLKIAFDKEGIEIPFPQRVIHRAKS
jgi:small-conductance mechanosensitive channel